MELLQGQLLVAAPGLRDPHFFHTVVLLVRHNEDGAFGLIINRTSGTQVQQVWDQVSQQPCHSDEAIRVGGPIDGPLMALHARGDLDDPEVLPGVFFVAERLKLEQLVAVPVAEARFFVGYAGWSAGQLEGEMAEGAWLTIAASAPHVFDRSEDLWERLHKEIGGSRLLSTLGIKHVPADPRLN